MERSPNLQNDLFVLTIRTSCQNSQKKESAVDLVHACCLYSSIAACCNTTMPPTPVTPIGRDRYPRMAIIQQIANSIFSKMDEDRAPSAVDRTFKSLFGCSIFIAYQLKIFLDFYHTNIDSHNIKHMLWALCFLKLYPTEDQMAAWFDADRVTVRKHLWFMLKQIANLHDDVVSYFTILFLFFDLH